MKHKRRIYVYGTSKPAVFEKRFTSMCGVEVSKKEITRFWHLVECPACLDARTADYIGKFESHSTNNRSDEIALRKDIALAIEKLDSGSKIQPVLDQIMNSIAQHTHMR